MLLLLEMILHDSESREKALAKEQIRSENCTLETFDYIAFEELEIV